MNVFNNPDLGCNRAAVGGVTRIYLSQRSRFGVTWLFQRTTAPLQYGRIIGHTGPQNVWFDAGNFRKGTATLTSTESAPNSRQYDVTLNFQINEWDLTARSYAEQLFASRDMCFIVADNLGQYWMVGEYDGCDVQYTSNSGDFSGASEIVISATCRQRTPLRQVADSYVDQYINQDVPCLCDVSLVDFCTLGIDDLCTYSLVCAGEIAPYVPTPPMPFFEFLNAWLFDGVNDHALAINSPSLNFGTGDFSISMWVYAATPISGGAQRLLAKFEDIPGRTGYDIYLRASTGYVLTFNVMDGNVGANFGPIYSQLPPNTWTHLVFVKETQDPLNWKCYRNGVLDAPLGYNGTGLLTGPIDNTRDLYLCEHSPAIGQEFNGRVDETTIYNRGLTADEASYLYNNGNGNAPRTNMETNLVARWSFDEANGSLPAPSTPDLSGNGNTLIGQNFAASPLVPH